MLYNYLHFSALHLDLKTDLNRVNLKDSNLSQRFYICLLI